MSTRRTLYRYEDERTEVHVFEELSWTMLDGPVFYLYAFRKGDRDVCVKIPESAARELSSQLKLITLPKDDFGEHRIIAERRKS